MATAAQPDLLDFFSAPVSAPTSTATSRKNSSTTDATGGGESSKVKAKPKAAVVAPQPPAAEEETFDFTSHLKADPNLHVSSNFNDTTFDDDDFESLHGVDRQPVRRASGAAGPAVSLSERLYQASNVVIGKIDEVDQRAGVSRSIREADARHGFSRKMSQIEQSATRQAERLSHELHLDEAREKVKHGVGVVRDKVQKATRSRTNSNAASTDTANPTTRSRSGSTSLDVARPVSTTKRDSTSQSKPTFAIRDEVLSSSSESESDDEPAHSPQPFAPIPVVKDRFSYHPRADSLAASSASDIYAAAASGVIPPPARLEVASLPRDEANGTPSAGVRSPVSVNLDTPMSANGSNSRRNSLDGLTFASLRLDDVALTTPTSTNGQALFSPDSVDNGLLARR